MKILAVLFTIVLLFSGCIQAPVEETSTVPDTTVSATTVPVERGPASDAVVFREIADDEVVPALLSGEMDYCLTSLTPDQALELEGSEEIKLYYASSQIEGVIMNPAPAPEGEINPFSLQEVRFAMQYLIDRGSIVDDIHKGFATPIVTNINPEHPGYEVIEDVVDEYGIVHDTEKAGGMIGDAMVDAGAEKVDGSWEYGGQPVVIKALVSAKEGEFRDIGELVSSALEDAGFSVERVYMERGDESPTYYSDPAELQWHLSITGWIYYGFSRYEEVSFPETYNKDGWWQYENEEIEGLKDGLDNYSSRAEWERTNRELAGAYIEDSVSIWLTSKKNVFAARAEVEGLIEDKFVGLRSYGNVRQAHVPGKGELVIGNRYTYETEDSWNPVVVEGIYMMDILNTIHDPMTWSDPDDLSKGPFRWDYSIETEGPDGKMGVPADAFVWDVDDKDWVSVGDGVESKSRVTYDLSKYVGTNWHHGAEIGWADVLYFTASVWDRSYDGGKQEMSSDAWKSYLEPVRGLRIDGNVLEVYTDTWSFSEEEFLGFARLFQRVAPWEIYAAGDRVVFGDRTLVYNRYEMPEGLDVPAMSLVNESHVGSVLEALDGLEYAEIEPFVTAGGISYATEDDLQERVKAVHGWYDGHGNLIISDGPFYLDRYNADGSLELRAFRDPGYPFVNGVN